MVDGPPLVHAGLIDPAVDRSSDRFCRRHRHGFRLAAANAVSVKLQRDRLRVQRAEVNLDAYAVLIGAS